MAIPLPLLDPSPVRPTYAQGPRDLDAVRLLRLSITDRCNLRCVYCMPEDGVPFSARTDLLTADDIVAVARAARQVGIDHFKLTGGEPTVRKDLVDIVAALARLEPTDLSLTSNGLLLDKIAKPLREAGLDRITLSWDTMQPDRFARIARGGARDGEAALAQLRRGIAAAERAGFERLKFNVVVIGGVNDDEVADFAALTVDRPWTVRFIEYMPLGESTLIDDAEASTVDNTAVRERIEAALGALQPVQRDREAGVGPAQVYRLQGAAGRIGFISAMSQPFCETCNRLRLTATGELRSCLFDGGEVSVLPALRPQPRTDELIALMRRCVTLKPETHSTRGNRAMSQMGG